MVGRDVPRVRCVFSVGRRQVRLGNGGPPGSRGEVLPPANATGVPHPHLRWPLVRRILHSCTNVLRASAADLLHTALPSDCRVCGSPMLGLRAVRICNACLDRVGAQAASHDTLCTRCGEVLGMESARFAASMGVVECTPCRNSPPAFARAVAYAAYDDEMREMIHALKFDGMRRVAEYVLGDWMADAIMQLQGQAGDNLVLVPVPLFRERERERGFNQAELLARAAQERLRKLRPAWNFTLQPQALERTRDTKALFSLNPDQRRRNLTGAFRVGKGEAIRDREVLLIDDILTSGATANACAKVLLRGGAKKVWVATVARAQPESTRALEESVASWTMAVSQ